MSVRLRHRLKVGEHFGACTKGIADAVFEFCGERMRFLHGHGIVHLKMQIDMRNMSGQAQSQSME